MSGVEITQKPLTEYSIRSIISELEYVSRDIFEQTYLLSTLTCLIKKTVERRYVFKMGIRNGRNSNPGGRQLSILSAWASEMTGPTQETAGSVILFLFFRSSRRTRGGLSEEIVSTYIMESTGHGQYCTALGVRFAPGRDIYTAGENRDKRMGYNPISLLRNGISILHSLREKCLNTYSSD
jgi:hypothetical protein